MNILPDIENQTVEFKTSFNDEVIETLVAFTNAKGGTVYVGLNDEGKPQGVTVSKETIQNWINEIKNKTATQIIPDAEEFDIEGKSIVALTISENPVKPVAFKGRFYKRVKNSN
ncbi:MAG: ATP-binding protein, partial [Prevotellaceae bacterium]|nr:ATP-binding protein [Prevotellaceae bacterium]